eukprot:TRINITY_DN2980_c0_g1_i4.p1 TRINITY_DN2980_c0_g1~~TRINITY_DN2980_c0_g1_i4.p1  ORF type:complete len:313 (-),score=53.53 TRINITY_DN2980_c0_g1_i4:40-978(-)
MKIVIFSNQGGLEKNKEKPADIKGKILDIIVKLGFPAQAFVAGATDIYRKPNTTMWELFVSKYNKNVTPDLSACMYIGDAAGRIKGWKIKKPKDFSCSDRKFASNIGIEFKTPEEYFLDEKPVSKSKWEWGSLDPVQFLKEFPEETLEDKKDYTSDSQEVVIMVGRPASGKSTFAKNNFKDYTVINRDKLTTQTKCLKEAKLALSDGKSIVVDNTNPDLKSRKPYIDLAKEKGIPVRCFWYDTDMELTKHLNFYREKVTCPSVRRIPDVAYHTYNKKFVAPSEKEGFDKVTKISFVSRFKNDEHRRLFLQRT